MKKTGKRVKKVSITRNVKTNTKDAVKQTKNQKPSLLQTPSSLSQVRSLFAFSPTIFFIITLGLAILSTLSIPFVAELSRVLLAFAFVGIIVGFIIGESLSIASLVALSLAVSTSLVLFLSIFLAPNSASLRILFAASVVLLGLIALWKSTRSVSSSATSHSRYKDALARLLPLGVRPSLWLALAVAIPLVIIVACNPFIYYLSDGWWHASVYAMAKHFATPLPNPWLDSASLAYPYAMHVFLVYLFGTTTIPVHVLFTGLSIICALLASFVLAEFVASRTDEKTGMLTGIVFFLASTIGSILFFFDALQFAIRDGLAAGVASFKDFLAVHQGPHMWYTAMKFIDATGLNTVFQSTAMLGFFALPLFVGTVVFLFRKRYFLAALLFAPLLAANPVYAIIAAGFLGIVFLLDFGWMGLIWGAAVAFFAAAINASYLMALFSKTLVGSGSFVSILPHKGLMMLGLFVIGYLPLLMYAWLGFRNLRGRDGGKSTETLRTKRLVWAFFGVHLFVVLGLALGYLYASTTMMLGVALLAGPALMAELCLRKKSFARFALASAVLVVSIVSTLLIVATYSYYTIKIDASQQDAASWLRENTPPHALVFMELGNLSNRTLMVYPSAFGERRVYLADLPSLEAYGEDYAAQRARYDKIFIVEPINADEVCVLDDYPASAPVYLWTNANSSRFTSVPCAMPIYQNSEIRIYRISSAK